MEKKQKLLISPSNRKFLVKDTSQDYHMQFGRLTKEDMAKAKDGDILTTNTGKQFAVLTPQFIDLYHKMKRGAQIIPLKDIGLIVAETGINKSSVVVDAGAGSGGSCLMFAHLCKKVHVFDIRDDHLDTVRKNIGFLGLKNIVLKNQDITKSIPVKNADFVNLDIAEPWNAIDAAFNALKVGGFLVSYSPCIPQVSDFVEAARQKKGLTYIKTVELILREWEAEGRKIRPVTLQMGHSGFLTFCRKISKA